MWQVFPITILAFQNHGPSLFRVTVATRCRLQCCVAFLTHVRGSLDCLLLAAV